MALDIQVVSADGIFLPFDTEGYDQRQKTPLPQARVVFQDDALSLDGSGVGDNAVLQLTFPLEGENVYLLESFMVRQTDPSTNVNWGYGDAYLYMYPLTRPVAQGGQETKIAFKVADEIIDQVGDLSWQRLFYLGIGGALTAQRTGVAYFDGVQDAGRIWNFGEELGATSPLLEMSLSSQNMSSTTSLAYYVSFLQFDYEQYQKVPMHYRIPTR